MAPPIYAGIRILELGENAAVASATRFFSEQGATVVRIDPPSPRDPAAEGPGAGSGDPGLAAGKHRIPIDLTTEEGVALMLRLVERADVVVEGLAPGGLARLGLAPERLLAHKPDLILVSVSLAGQTGPQREVRGGGTEAAAIAGFSHLTGWEDRAPAAIGDPLSPRYVALLVASALLARSGSGRGQHLDVSQVEAGVYSLAEWLARGNAGCEGTTRAGNRDEEGAPHGIYPCDGEDAWIAIAVYEDEEWDALLAAMGDPDWAADPRFATAASRRRHADALDAGVAAWTRDFAPFELMAGLQAAGVPAGVVQHGTALRRDPQLAHRGHFVRLAQPNGTPVLVERAGFRIGEQPHAFESFRPARDGDVEAALCDLFGFEPHEVAALRARGTLA